MNFQFSKVLGPVWIAPKGGARPWQVIAPKPNIDKNDADYQIPNESEIHVGRGGDCTISVISPNDYAAVTRAYATGGKTMASPLAGSSKFADLSPPSSVAGLFAISAYVDASDTSTIYIDAAQYTAIPARRR